MRITTSQLRHIIREELQQSFHDVYFIEDVLPTLLKTGELPTGVGKLIGYGNEAVVMEYGSDRIIRIHPTYQYDEAYADMIVKRLRNAPSGGLYARIFDVGEARDYDDDVADVVTFAVWAIIERLDPISKQDAKLIDDVVTGRATTDDIESAGASITLIDFLDRYMSLSIDKSSENVMLRDDKYVIVDPE